MRNDDLEFTVTLRVKPGRATNSIALRLLRDDLNDLINDAALGYVGDPARALYQHTPDDTGDADGFRCVVGNPRLPLLDAIAHPATVQAVDADGKVWSHGGPGGGQWVNPPGFPVRRR